MEATNGAGGCEVQDEKELDVVRPGARGGWSSLKKGVVGLGVLHS